MALLASPQLEFRDPLDAKKYGKFKLAIRFKGSGVGSRDEHGIAHLHVKYNEYSAEFDILHKRLIDGALPETETKEILELLNNSTKRNRLMTHWRKLARGEEGISI